MLTDKDIAQIEIKPENKSVTKDELQKQLFELKTEILQTFVTKVEFHQAMNELRIELKNDMRLGFTAILTEIRAMRAEMAAQTLRLDTHSNLLDSHESRLHLLEDGPS